MGIAASMSLISRQVCEGDDFLHSAMLIGRKVQVDIMVSKGFSDECQDSLKEKPVKVSFRDNTFPGFPNSHLYNLNFYREKKQGRPCVLVIL